MELKVLQRFFVKLFLSVVLILFLIPHATEAMPEILPFDQLKSGMKGKAYTVVDGSGKIENFDVEIIGVTNEGKGSLTVMAKASGEVIRRTGGMLQGMSGSPVYIDGKLVGALAATLKEMDPYTVFITPIEKMLELWKLPDPKAEVNYFKAAQEKNKPDEPENKDDATEEIAEPVEDTAEVEESSEVEELDAFYLSGFDTNGANFLQRELGLKKIQSSSNTIERGLKFDANLEPGSAEQRARLLLSTGKKFWRSGTRSRTAATSIIL